MAQINVRTTTVRKKSPAKPQRKIQARKTVINNQMARLNASRNKKR